MLGYNLFKIIHLCSLVVLSGLVITGARDQKVTKLKWFLIFLSTIMMGLSGVLLLSNLGFMSSKLPFWVYLKIAGFGLMVILSILGLKKLWSEKLFFFLWLFFSILMIIISVKKFYY